MDTTPPPSFQGKPNVYTCEACHGETVTVDVDAGVTPFMLGCHATPGCSGMAQSAMYRVPPERVAEATHEWYKPASLDGLSSAEQAHVQQGGLLLRARPGTHTGRFASPTSAVAPRRGRALGTIAALAALGGRGLPSRFWRGGSKMTGVSLTARLQAATTAAEIAGLLAEGASYPHASDKSRREWLKVANTRRVVLLQQLATTPPASVPESANVPEPAPAEA